MGENQNNDTNKKCKLKNIISGFKNLSATAKYFWGLFVVIVIVAIFFSIVLFSYSASLEDIKYANISTLLNEINDKLENHLTFESTVTLEDYAYLLDQKLKLENEIDGYDNYTVFNDVLDKMQAQYDGFTGSLSNLLIFVGTIIVIVPILLSIFNYVFNKDLLNNLQNQMSEYKELASDAKKYSQIFSLFTEANVEEELSEKIKILSRIISIDENNQSAYNNRGNVYFENKEYSNAVNDYTRAIEINKKDDKEDIDKMYSEYYNRAHAYYLNKNYKNAIGDYNLLINRNPTMTLICERARIKFDDKDYDGAIEDYNMVINKNPELAYPYINRGEVYIRLKDYDRAIYDFKKATKLNPSKSSYNVLGFTYFLKKSFDKAINFFTKAIESKNEDSDKKAKKSDAIFEPINLPLFYKSENKFNHFISKNKESNINNELIFKDLEVHYEFSSPLINRANVYNVSGQYEKAIEDYTKVIELESENANYYNYRGTTYYLNKEYEKAIEDYTKAIELEPENADYYIARGISYAYNKEYEKAIKDFSKALELNPEKADYYIARGSAYGLNKNYEKAIEDFSKAIEIDPKYAEAYNGRGNAYVKMGEIDKKTENYNNAIKDFSKAIELDPSSKNFNSRANLYRKMGKDDKKFYGKALSDAKKAIDLDSDNFYVYATLAEIHASMGNDEEFYKNLELALSKDYPLIEAIKDEPDIKELYDKYKDQEKFKALMKEYEIDYK